MKLRTVTRSVAELISRGPMRRYDPGTDMHAWDDHGVTMIGYDEKHEDTGTSVPSVDQTGDAACASEPPTGRQGIACYWYDRH